jgi:succinate dehydrogenase hydrophobic anchor subunit
VVTHITTDVANTGVGFVTRRWGSVLWLVWDSLMFTAGIAHAGCGLWVVVNDHTTSARARRATHGGLVALCVVLIGFGLALVIDAAG